MNSTEAEVVSLPLKYKDKNFNNFEAVGRLEKIKKGLIELSSERDNNKSIILIGGTGCGKTHLAIAFMKNIPPILPLYKHQSIRPARCLFLNADQFFMVLQNVNALGKTKDVYIDDILIKHQIVCLDDLSSFNFTPAKTENLYYFVNQAYMNNRRFIITTNYSEDEFKTIDPRIYSRIAEMSIIVKFNNGDYRIEKK